NEALFAGLNPAQREAVAHGEGPILVLAGAGSGKTRVLTTRITRLILEERVRPERVLSVTFTNKAAGEMRERIGRMLGDDPKGMWMGTFHSIGARMVRRAAHHLHRTPSFTIYDEDEQLAVIKRLMERHRIPPKQFAPRAIRAAISDAKNAMVSAEEFTKLARDPFAQAVAPVYGDLDEALRIANAVDFDDLLLLPVRLLEQNPDELKRWQGRFDHILVDEYQDTNRAQYRFVKLLGGVHRNVCVVGDDDQSIYGWRGADIRNILDFTKDFPNAAVVRLEENYRSTPQILTLANAVISVNTSRMGKTLRATRPGGEKVSLLRCLDERDEADWILQDVMTRRGQKGTMLRDVAVLYRTNSQSRALEEACRRHAVPYRLVGSVRFYDRREIRDLMAYLRLVANPSDDEAFRRAVGAPRRGIGDTTVEWLAERARVERLSLFAAASRPDILAETRPASRAALAGFVALIEKYRADIADYAVDELIREIVIDVNYAEHLKSEGEEIARERLENVRELINGAAETVADEGGEAGVSPLDSFLQRAALIADVDALKASGSDAVTFMTMHNAKGLEFPVVYITGLEDGLFPLARSYDDPPLLEEERRLFYVGITRAQQALTLTFAEERRRNGELTRSRQSSFLDEVPKGMVEERSTVKARSTGRAVLSSMFGNSRGYGSGGYGSRRGGFESSPGFDDDSFSVPASRKRAGTPVTRRVEPEDESQDPSALEVGARVRHRKFGAGTIAEFAGVGRDAKVKIDFDDESIGRKTLVVAQANLEPVTD
ncbi:MAG TPA: UvrD-helicase domain-containing protein, partial [Gemmatimonadaceae bacterium]|nr:UvrD-helicase domain-containing protein [Gemmatimonadaceae bacterium]